MTTEVTNQSIFDQRTEEVLRQLKDTGQLKSLQMIEGPMDATVSLRGRGEVACFCSNNYLGLSNHPAVKFSIAISFCGVPPSTSIT